MLNYENEGTRICRIADSKKHINKTISVYGDDDEGFKELTLPDNDASHFQIVPTNKERTVQFVCGSSGSGKSYFTAQYVKEYRKMFPDRQVYLFSAMPKDDNFDKLGYVKRIKMDDTLITVCPCEAVVVLTSTLRDDRDEIEMNLRLIAMHFVIVKIKL